MESVPGLSDGITSPWIWVVMLAASRRMPAASMTLNPAQGAVPPVSVIIRPANSSVFEARISAAFKSSARLCPGPVFDQAGNAADAASTAAATSSSPEAGVRVASLPVKGSRRS